MIFNSLIFLVFFAIVYSSYLLLRRHYRLQNLLLLAASYVFYGFWDWRFLSLILISTFVDFYVGAALGRQDKSARSRKKLLFLSIAVNLSLLGFFKYFNFFAENFVLLVESFGMTPSPITLNVLLPVGISFYTFQTLSYTIDIYRGKLTPTRSLPDFALFVAFFPQLVAGPIERARRLLPQITAPRVLNVDQMNAGLFLILWGYFKKVVIADNVAFVANTIFDGHLQYSGLDLLIGAFAFAIQIYCDFSGYSDIARGLCKLMGFDLMVNFRLPYFAKNPSDFWLRWHISLSSWLRDYLYIPLGGNRGSALNTYRNLFVTMLLGGLWHGASWNFVLWGAFHGSILCVYRIVGERKLFAHDIFIRISAVRQYFGILIMFGLTLIGWILFRAQTYDQVIHMIVNLGIRPSSESFDFAYRVLFFSLPLIVMQICQQRSGNLLVATRLSLPVRSAIYAAMLVGILIFGVRESIEFIYFQF